MRSALPSAIFGRSIWCGRYGPTLLRPYSPRMVGSEHLGRGIHALMLVEEGAHITGKRSVVGLPAGVQRSGGLFIGTAYLAPTDCAGGDERR